MSKKAYFVSYFVSGELRKGFEDDHGCFMNVRIMNVINLVKGDTFNLTEGVFERIKTKPS